MAPEVLQETSGHTEKANIWSLGITAIELATGSAPYAALSELDMVQKILKAPPPQLPRSAGFSSEFRDFVRKCMNSDPKRRRFIEKAKEPSYMVDHVLKGLPPLGHRYAALHTTDSVLENLVQNMSESSESNAAMSLPIRIEWSFHDETDPPPLKKGRFTIKREPTSHTRRVSSSAVPDRQTPMDELRQKVIQLTSENAALRQEVVELKETIAELPG
jgi:serine/threonine-protein kinase OSR1/STK39